MPTMEQRRKKLIGDDSLFAGVVSAFKLPPVSTPSKPAPLTPPPSLPRPSSSKLTTESHDDDRQAQCRARALSESHHDPDDNGARAANKEPAPQPEFHSSYFGFPINENMPLASTKGWALDSLIARAPRTFRHADRVSAALPAAELARKIEEYEESGRPLVIEGFHKLPSWPKKKFTLEGFVEDAVEDTINARNVHTWTDATLKLSDFIEKSRAMGPYAQEGETERWYGKDMDCPPSWEDWLKQGKAVPASLHPNGPHDKFRYRPKSAEVQTLMCYLGVGDTFTPCHKDLCASSGHNLMCYTEKNGSSFWFMTESSVAPKASQYFQKLRHELDHENHIITLEELSKAPFDVYILEQKLGDLVLVPPRSCHQVVNAGGITIKTSWSRMTSKGLKTAYFHELPIYRRVCRPETYKVKSTIFYSIIREAEELAKLMEDAHDTSSVVATTSKSKKNTQKSNISKPSTPEASAAALANDLMELISVADCILAEEYDTINKNMPQMFSGNRFETEATVICDFCRCDIFQSFFECRNCVDGGISSGERMHICAGCYVEGRTCDCSNMQPIQYGNFQELVDAREQAVQKVSQYEQQQGRSYNPKLKLINDSVPGLFRAACYLYQKRLSAMKDTKSCRLMFAGSKSHEVPFHWGLHCKACHSSKCFAHLLETSKLHAVEALLLHTGDKSSKHEKYHAYHLSKSAMYYENLPALEESQRQGTRYPGYSWLVYNALTYSHCTPVNMKYVRFGWYDNQLFEEESEDEGASATASTDMAPALPAEKTPPVHRIGLPTSPKVTITLKPSSSSAKPRSFATPTSLAVSTSPHSQEQPAMPQTPTPAKPQRVRSSSSESAEIEMVDSYIRVASSDVAVNYLSSDDEPLINLLQPARKKQKSTMIIPPSPKRTVSTGTKYASGVQNPRPVVQMTRDDDDIIRRPPRMGQVYVFVPPAPYSLERRPPPPVASPRPPSPALSIRSESPLTSLRSDSPLSDVPSELSRRSESPPPFSRCSKSRKIVESESSEDEIEDADDEAMQPGPSTLPKLNTAVRRKPLVMTEDRARPGSSTIWVSQARSGQHLSRPSISKEKGKGKVPPIPRKTHIASSSVSVRKDIVSSTRIPLQMTEEVTRPGPSASSTLKRKNNNDHISAPVPEFSHKVRSGGKSSTGARAGPLSKTTKRQKTNHTSSVRQPEEDIGAAGGRSLRSPSPTIVVTLPQRTTTTHSRTSPPLPSKPQRKPVNPPKSVPTAQKELDTSSTKPAKSVKSVSSTTSLRETKPLPARGKSAPSAALGAAAPPTASTSKLHGTTFTARSGLVGRVGKRRSESQTTDVEKGAGARSTDVVSQGTSASSFMNTSGPSKFQRKKRPRTRASEAEPLGPSKVLSAEQAGDKASTDIDTTKKVPLNKLRFKRIPASALAEPSSEQHEEVQQQQDTPARSAERGHHHFLEVDADVDCTSASNLLQSNSEAMASCNITDVAPSTPTPLSLLPPPLPPPPLLEPPSLAPPQPPQLLESSSQTSPPPPPSTPPPTIPQTSLQTLPTYTPVKPSWGQMIQEVTLRYPDGPTPEAMFHLMLQIAQGSPGASGQPITYPAQPPPSAANASTEYVNDQQSAYAHSVQPQGYDYDYGHSRHRGPPRAPRAFHRGSYSHRHRDELSGERRYGNSEPTYPRHYDREDRRDPGPHAFSDRSYYNSRYQRASRFNDFESRDRRGGYQKAPYAPKYKGHGIQGRGGHRSTYHRPPFSSSASYYDRNNDFERGSRRRFERASHGGDRDMDTDDGGRYGFESPGRGGHHEPREDGLKSSSSSAFPPMDVDVHDDDTSKCRRRNSSVHLLRPRDVSVYPRNGTVEEDDRLDWGDHDDVADVHGGEGGKGGSDSVPAQQLSTIP